MLRNDGDPELRVFDPVIRLRNWLTLVSCRHDPCARLLDQLHIRQGGGCCTHPATSLVRRGCMGGDAQSFRLAPVLASLIGPQTCCGNSVRGALERIRTPEDSHFRVLPDPSVNLSTHTAPDFRPFPW